MLADKLSIYVDTFSLCKLIGQYQQGHRVKGDRQPSMPKFARYGIDNKDNIVNINNKKLRKDENVHQNSKQRE